MESQTKEHHHSGQLKTDEMINDERVILINNILENPHDLFTNEEETSWSIWQWTSLIVTVIVGILSLLLLYRRLRKSSKNNFLLVGLSQSGKTAIFMRLVCNKFKTTFISVDVNIGTYRTGGLTCTITDIPGEYRIRDKFFEEYKNTAQGIIFVVDSSTIVHNCANVADALFTILSDIDMQTCPILVLCTKQDLPTAKSTKIIQNMLANEINVLRDTRKRKLQSLDMPNDDNIIQRTVEIGKVNKSFEWHHLKQNVQFYDCSARAENRLNNLSDWIDRML